MKPAAVYNKYKAFAKKFEDDEGYFGVNEVFDSFMDEIEDDAKRSGTAPVVSRFKFADAFEYTY